MGYTHYWDHTEAFTTDEWNQITDKVNKIVNWCQNNKIPLQYEYDMVMPVLNDSHQIRFNGVEDDGHETFMIKRVPSKTWDFCKQHVSPMMLLLDAVSSFSKVLMEISLSSDLMEIMMIGQMLLMPMKRFLAKNLKIS
jgi:hypothetical protein